VAHYKGRIIEILLEPYQNASALISVDNSVKPEPGQYLQAHQPDDREMVTPISLFLAGEVELAGREAKFAISGVLPPEWEPGTEIAVSEARGHGFELPTRAKRVALIALAGNPGRLLPLVPMALRQHAEVALFCDAPVRELPSAVEVRGLEAEKEAFAWAEFIAIDIELIQVEEIGALLGIRERLPKALVAQVLVHAPMPCGGLAKCGVCAFSSGRGERLACEDGPVFELRGLL
jgi:hypothetical protein